MIKAILGLGLATLLYGGHALADCPVDRARHVVGETAVISVEQAGIDYLARIDTGARITSIHAVDIAIDAPSSDLQQNIGKQIAFTTVNEKGEQRRIKGVIRDVARVRNAQGVEYRYVVDLELGWRGFDKTVQVNLRDRSAMSYKLLIGRNWLDCDVIVDVSKSEGSLD